MGFYKIINTVYITRVVTLAPSTFSLLVNMKLFTLVTRRCDYIVCMIMLLLIQWGDATSARPVGATRVVIKHGGGSTPVSTFHLSGNGQQMWWKVDNQMSALTKAVKSGKTSDYRKVYAVLEWLSKRAT